MSFRGADTPELTEASKQGFNTEITEKKIKPQSFTEKFEWRTNPSRKAILNLV